LQCPPQPGQAFKISVPESCDRIKEEFNFLQTQYHTLVSRRGVARVSAAFLLFRFLSSARASERECNESCMHERERRTWEQAQLCYTYVAARECTNSSLTKSARDAPCIFQQRARGSKVFSLPDADGSLFSFFSAVRHVRSIFYPRRIRFRCSLSLSLSLSVCLLSVCRSAALACVSRNVLPFFPQIKDGMRETSYREDRDSAALRNGECNCCR